MPPGLTVRASSGITCCSRVSFESRLSEGNVPARSEKLVRRRQKSSSGIRDGSVSAAAASVATSQATDTHAARHATLNRPDRGKRIDPIVVQQRDAGVDRARHIRARASDQRIAGQRRRTGSRLIPYSARPAGSNNRPCARRQNAARKRLCGWLRPATRARRTRLECNQPDRQKRDHGQQRNLKRA